MYLIKVSVWVSTRCLSHVYVATRNAFRITGSVSNVSALPAVLYKHHWMSARRWHLIQWLPGSVTFSNFVDYYAPWQGAHQLSRKIKTAHKNVNLKTFSTGIAAWIRRKKYVLLFCCLLLRCCKDQFTRNHQGCFTDTGLILLFLYQQAASKNSIKWTATKSIMSTGCESTSSMKLIIILIKLSSLAQTEIVHCNSSLQKRFAVHDNPSQSQIYEGTDGLNIQ